MLGAENTALMCGLVCSQCMALWQLSIGAWALARCSAVECSGRSACVLELWAALSGYS